MKFDVKTSKLLWKAKAALNPVSRLGLGFKVGGLRFYGAQVTKDGGSLSVGT